MVASCRTDTAPTADMQKFWDSIYWSPAPDKNPAQSGAILITLGSEICLKTVAKHYGLTLQALREMNGFGKYATNATNDADYTTISGDIVLKKGVLAAPNTPAAQLEQLVRGQNSAAAAPVVQNAIPVTAPTASKPSEPTFTNTRTERIADPIY